MYKNFVERVLSGLWVYADAADAGGAGGTETQVTDNNGTTKTADDNGTKQSDAASKPGAAPVKPADDARYNGLMADLQKERKARQQYDADLKAAKADLERERKRIQALVGVNPKSDEEAEEELVRARLGKLIPGLDGLTAEDIKALRELRTMQAEMQAATTHTWQSHGRKMLGAVTSGVEKALGGKLSERQIARVERAYVAEAEANPDFLKRHEDGDPTLAEEFVKGWIEDFVEPAKRQALASEVSRQRRVPSGKDRSIIGVGDKKIDVTDNDAVADMLVKGFRERGGEFRSHR